MKTPLFLLPILVVAGMVFPSSILKQSNKTMSQSNTGSSISESYYTSMYNGKVKVYKLKKHNRSYGQSVWLYRTGKRVKAKYFAYKQNGKSIYQRFNEWKRNKKIISYCAGPYTTQDYTKPVGLTIDNGKLVNRNVDMNLDGLIIVEAVGGVRVADLDKKPCINLVSINKNLNPRTPGEKYPFINWAKRELATVFQTNLMYFKDEKKFGNVKETAKRRIFVLAIDRGQVVHIIFNIEERVSLTEASTEVYNYLKFQKRLKIIGILNFDTGMYNIFQVFNQSGKEDNKLRGTTSVSSAKNLFVYYYQ